MPVAGGGQGRQVWEAATEESGVVSSERRMVMRFIEMTGRTLARVVTEKELSGADLVRARITDDTVVRINEQGDIEVRRRDQWDLIGGLLGEYAERIQRITGLDWA